MSAFFIHHRSPHHAKTSGYARLMDYYPNATKIQGRPSIPYKLGKFMSTLVSQKAGLYNTDSIYKELELYKGLRANQNNSNVVHYLNAERDIRYVLKFKKRFKNVRFYGTFHKPPSILKWRISNPKYVKHLDGAIVVGKNQESYIKEHLNIKNVSYIPHGVDTGFFKPDISKRVENRLLFVGQHLRDFKTFNHCVPLIADKVKNLSVHVVIHPSYKKEIIYHDSIKIFSNLNDAQLKEQYQRASILFLPMLNSTACNSILEALACGLPIVTTDVGGNYEYLKNTKSVLAPVDSPSFLIDNTVALLKDSSELKYRSDLAHKKSSNFDWNKISGQVLKFHNEFI